MIGRRTRGLSTLTLAAMLVACSSADTTKPGSPPTGTPTAAAAATPQAAPPSVAPPTLEPAIGPVAPPEWTRVADPGPLPPGLGIAGLVAVSDGFLVAINVDSDGSQPTAGVFRSATGSTWESTGRLPGQRGATLNDMTLGESGAVVVGEVPRTARGGVRLVDTCESEPSGVTGATWWSSNGAEWSREGRGRAFEFGAVRAITAIGDDFVAVGGENPGSGLGVSVAWTSPDGRQWSQSERSEALRSGVMRDIAALGDRIVAVGGTECMDVSPMAWTSADGRSWTSTSLGSMGRASVVAAGPGGFLAAGWSGDDDDPTAAWRSADGRTWETATLPISDLAKDITGLPDRYLLVDDNGKIWSSRGDDAWSLAFAPAEGMAQRVAVGHGVAVAVGTGWAEPEQPPPAAVWTLPLDALP